MPNKKPAVKAGFLLQLTLNGELAEAQKLFCLREINTEPLVFIRGSR